MSFSNNIAQELSQLIGKDFNQKKFLLAISGGVDSMVLLHVFKQLDFNVEVAHCNFQLRSDASNLDEALVVDFCQNTNIKCHVKRFDTNGILENEGGSIQETARRLRYDWFNTLMPKFDYLVTAHHLNDNVETFFINLSRGSGLKGLSGIPQYNESIIRPLLNETKEAILAYAKENNIEWREDVSNQADTYLRNFFRNTIIPKIEEEKPQFVQSVSDNIKHLKQSHNLLDFFISKAKKELVKDQNGVVVINLEQMALYPEQSMLLFELIKTYGFNYTQVENLLDSSQSGKQIVSNGYKAILDRGTIHIAPIINASPVNEQYNSIEELKASPFFSEVEVLDSLNSFKTESKTALIDMASIQFPLHLKNWVPGDSFQPYGMKGQKKVSDFLIDNKISLIEKKNILLLSSASTPLWLVGYRTDERSKVTADSKRILKLVTK